MNIGSIGGSAAMFTPSAGPPEGMRKAMEKSMEPTAKLLGLSGDDLKSQLSSGKTLDDLASAKGVSHDDLVAAIEQGMAAAAPSGVQPPAGFDPHKMAEAIAAGKGPGGPGGPGGPREHSGSQDKLASLSSALGVDISSLLEQLQSGNGSDLFDDQSPYSKTAGLSTSGFRADYQA